MQQFDARAVMAARIAQECSPKDLRGPSPARGGTAPQAQTASGDGGGAHALSRPAPIGGAVAPPPPS
jgi:hypothetical protein